jgi:hypothetical protein
MRPRFCRASLSRRLVDCRSAISASAISFLLKQIVLVVMVSVPREVGAAGWRRSTGFDLPLLAFGLAPRRRRFT